MTTIRLVIEVEDEFVDDDDDTGLTERGYRELVDGLMSNGVVGGIVTVERIIG